MLSAKEKETYGIFSRRSRKRRCRPAELRRPYAEKYPAKAPDAGSILREIRRLTTAYPYLVAEVNDQVVGCAFAAPLRDDPAYQWDAEVRIYCAEAFHGQGLGSALMLRLMRVLTVQGFVHACATVALPNDAALAFLKSFDFAPAGRLPGVAFHQGAWQDMLWLVRPLAQLPEFPTPPTPFEGFEREELAALIL